MMILERRDVMAKAPSAFDGASHGDGRLPSPARHAIHPVVIALTATASRHAADYGLSTALAALQLPETCAVDDLVSLENTADRHAFSIIRRRWIADGNGTRLEITLDHPAAASRR
ncbi:hypothetical protein [Terribium terrae]|jgi:hypothetical protein|nr:hypothetical protein [Mesorhizobium terrae]